MMEEANESSYQSSPNDKSTSHNRQPASGAEESNVEELINRALEQKQTIQTVNQLRAQMERLTGLFIIAVIVLGGGLGWAGYRLQVQQREIADQNVAAPEALERVQQLEDQMEELQEQIPNPKTIEDLQSQLDELGTTVEDNQKTLERALNETQTQQLQNDQSSESNGSDSLSFPSE